VLLIMGYQIFTQDKKLFVGVNAIAIPSIPEAQQDLPERPENITQIRWAIDTLPQLPFVLISASFHCSLLSPLNIVNIVKDGSGFCMAQKNLEKWKNLERCLMHCAETLFHHAHRNNSLPTPSGFNPLAKKFLPRAYGYTLSYPSYEAADSCVKRSKEGFNLLFALVSYGIICAAGADDLLGSCAHPQWAKILQKADIHPAWVESLQSSPIADFSAKRVGAFVSTMTSPHWCSQIPLMERAGCPLFIQWEDGSYQFGSDNVMRKYQPSQTAIREATRGFCTSQLAAVPSCEIAPLLPIFEHKYARPSGQPKGETMEEFFARREENNKKRIEHEKPAEKQRRESRAKAAEKHDVPGKSSKAAAVFIWEPDDSGVLIRRAICRGDVEDEFLAFSKEQRRYDAFRNEWDCYLGWAPNAISDEDRENAYFHPEEDIQMWDPLPGPDPPTPPRTPTPISISPVTLPTIATPSVTLPAIATPSVTLPTIATPSVTLPAIATPSVTLPAIATPLVTLPTIATPSVTLPTIATPSVTLPTIATPSVTSQLLVPSVPRRLSALDTHYADSLADMYAPVVEIGEFIDEAVIEDLEDALYYRYGFCWDQNDYDPIQHLGVAGSRKDIDIVQKCFVHADDGALRLSYHQPVRDFLHGLLAGRRGEDQFRLGPLWDISSTNPNRLQLPSSQLPSSLNPSQTLRPLNSFLIVRCQETGTRVLYYIESRDQEQQSPYQVVVEDAATALECYRRTWNTPVDVARCLVQSGKAFQTYVPKPPAPLYPMRRPYLSLGFRQAGYVFDTHDYRVFEDRLEQFFRLPHSRAALLSGGIVWRIAMEFIYPGLVLMGPSENVAHFGDVVQTPDGPIVDNNLTQEELNLICGVYEVYTGELTKVL
jgi:hypothetical protein